MIKHSIEWNETIGDARDEVREEESRNEVHEAIADEQEMTNEDIEAWASFWLDKEQHG